MPDQSSDLDWRDEIPVSTRFDDPYYSLENGLAETAHVFLAGNGLPGRFREGFHIAELGFGTGLNLLAAIIIYWNTKHLGQAVTARQRDRLDCSPDLLAHISPLGWAHILLTGEYRWPKR